MEGRGCVRVGVLAPIPSFIRCISVRQLLILVIKKPDSLWHECFLLPGLLDRSLVLLRDTEASG